VQSRVIALVHHTIIVHLSTHKGFFFIYRPPSTALLLSSAELQLFAAKDGREGIVVGIDAVGGDGDGRGNVVVPVDQGREEGEGGR
jgi:hypothetical protein